MKNKLLGAILVFLVLSALFLLGLVPVNLFFLKDNISEAIQKSTGFEVEINGSLQLVLGLNSQLTASGITVLPEIEQEDALFSIERLAINFSMREMLKGNIHVDSMVAEDFAINYCPRTPDEQNPSIEASSAASDFYLKAQQPLIALDELYIERVHLFCKQPDKMVENLPELFDLHGSAPPGQAMRVEIETLIDDERVYFSAKGGSLGQLFSDSTGFPLEVEISAFQAIARVKAEVQKLLTEPSIKAGFTIDSTNPTKLFDIANLKTIPADALSISAEISYRQKELQLIWLDGKLGEFQLGLSGWWQTSENRPRVEAKAHIPSLDLDLFTKTTTGTASSHQREQNWKEISIKPWLKPLGDIEAKLQLVIDQIDHAPFSLTDLSVELGIQQGQLTMEQAEIRLEDTRLSVSASLDTRLPCPELNSSIQVSDVDLELFRGILEQKGSYGGELGQVQVETTSCGEMLGEHLNGLHVIGHLVDASVWYEEPTDIVQISSLNTEFSWGERGWLNLDGILMGEPVRAEVSFASVEEILSPQSWPVKLTAEGAGSRIILNADTAFLNDQLEINGLLDLSVSRFGGLHQWIGSRPDNLLSGELHTKFIYGKQGLQFSTLEMQLGRSNFAGKFHHALSQKGPGLSVELKSQHLDIEELSTLFQETQPSGDYTPNRETERTVSNSDPDNPVEPDWLARWFNVPFLVFDISIDSIQTTAIDIDEIKFNGEFHEHRIKDGSLNFSVGTLGISGSVDADLGNKPWELAYRVDASNADIGSMLSKTGLAHGVSAHADHLAMQIASEGRTVSELAENANLQAQIENFTWLSHLATVEQSVKEFNVERLELTASPGKSTSWNARGTLNEIPVRFWLLSPSIQEVLSQKSSLPLRLVVGVGDDVLMADALLDMESGQEIRARLEISGEDFDTDEKNLSQLHPPLSDYQLTTQAVFKPGTMSFSELQASTGSSELSGQIKIGIKEKNYLFEIDLESPRIETDDFVQLAADWRLASEDETDIAAVQTSELEEEEGLVIVLNRELEKLSGRYSVDANVNVEELWSAGTLLGNTTIGLVTSEEEIFLDPFQITHPNGNVSGVYHGWTDADGYNVSLSFDTQRLKYDGLARLVQPDAEAGGWLHFDTDLQATARDPGKILSSLEGSINLAVFPDDIEAGFLDLWATNLVFALLPTGGSGKKLNCMVAQFEVTNGIMKSTNTFLDSTDTIVRGRGEIDLANGQLDFLFAPQAKVEKFFSVSTPIKVTGPFKDFQVGVTPGGFLGTMMSWYYGAIYVPWKWITGDRFPPDGIETCFKAMDWELPTQTD